MSIKLIKNNYPESLLFLQSSLYYEHNAFTNFLNWDVNIRMSIIQAIIIFYVPQRFITVFYAKFNYHILQIFNSVPKSS